MKFPIVFLGLALLTLAVQASHSAEIPWVPVSQESAESVAQFVKEANVNASFSTVPVTGQKFDTAARIEIRTASVEPNAVRLLSTTTAAISKGDMLVAFFSFRCPEPQSRNCSVAFKLQATSAPWTQSIWKRVEIIDGSTRWQRVAIPFKSLADMPIGGAFAGFQLALGIQSVEIGGFSVSDYGPNVTREQLANAIASRSPLGVVNVNVHAGIIKQTVMGLGGNYARSRFGELIGDESQDPIGRQSLALFRPVHARIGLPLKIWARVSGGDYAVNDPSVVSVFRLMKQFAANRIPITMSIWEVPDWMVDNPSSREQRHIPPDRYQAVTDAIGAFLLEARDKYGVKVDTLSFNEANYGINVKLTPADFVELVRVAGPRLATLGLNAKWLVGDTTDGRSCAGYCAPVLQDSSIAQYLGPISFHDWDCEQCPDSDYLAIAELGRKYSRPIWCLETGFDSSLWRSDAHVWEEWGTAARLAGAYWKAFSVANVALADYWQYQADYPLSGGPTGDRLFPSGRIMQELRSVLQPGAVVVQSEADCSDVHVLALQLPKDRQLRVVLVNSIGAGSTEISGLLPDTDVSITRSDANAQGRPDDHPYRTSASGELRVDLGALSVVTLSQAI